MPEEVERRKRQDYGYFNQLQPTLASAVGAKNENKDTSKMKLTFTLLFFLVALTGAMAQGSYGIGGKVEPFSLKDPSGKDVGLQDFAGSKAVVVVFTNNGCPFARQYENRLTSLARSYSGRGVQFLFVNPSVNQQEGGENRQEMAAKAAAGNYTFPYLADEGQIISSRFGATRTPEVFVLQNLNGEFLLRYKGAIDDNPQAADFVKEPYLRNALEAVLQNQQVQNPERRAAGCMIRRQ